MLSLRGEARVVLLSTVGAEPRMGSSEAPGAGCRLSDPISWGRGTEGPAGCTIAANSREQA